jgi:hypothetical protein
MNKLRAMISSAIAIVFLSTTPLIAGSQDWAGAYIAVQGSSMGVELDGKYTDSDNVITTGSGGKLLSVAGGEIGYNIPLGDVFFISVGGTGLPGKTKISEHDDAADAADIKVEATDFWSVYLAPSISLTDSSAIFIKYAENGADLTVTGDFTGTASTSLEGNSISMGTKTVFPSGMFVQSEAGLTEYDSIHVNDIGTAADDDSAKGDVKADPSIAFGNITIGYKF